MTHAYLHISTDSRTCATQIRIPRSVRFLCLLSCCLQSGGFFFALERFIFVLLQLSSIYTSKGGGIATMIAPQMLGRGAILGSTA